MPVAVEQLEDYLVRYLESVSVTSSYVPRTFWVASYGRHTAHFSSPMEPLGTIIEQLRKAYPRVSEKTLRDLLEAAAVDLFESTFVPEDGQLQEAVNIASLWSGLSGLDAGAKAEAIVVELSEQTKEYVFYFPVFGLKVDALHFSLVGGYLYPSDSAELIERLEKTHFPEWLRNKVTQEYQSCSAYFVCTETGDRTIAEQYARDRARAAIHVLRFYLTPSDIKLQQDYQRIRLVGEPEFGDIFLFVHETANQEGEKVGADWSEGIGPARAYRLTAEEIQRMNHNGLSHVQDAMGYAGSKTGTLRARLQRTIRWFGYAAATDELDQKFVGFAVALESLLTDQPTADPAQSWAGITQKLAERCAFLLSEQFDERVEITKQVKELYALRSRAVHGGFSVSPENVQSVQELARSVILALVAKKFGSWDSFTKWIKRCKYASTATKE